VLLRLAGGLAALALHLLLHLLLHLHQNFPISARTSTTIRISPINPTPPWE
jgi:hypothetical protein